MSIASEVWEDKYSKLEKENEELHKLVKDLLNDLVEATCKINDLKILNQKMKSCKNCFNSLYGNRGENGRCETCGNKDNWELAEGV